MTEDPVDISAQFLRAMRYGNPTDEFEEVLASCDSDDLAARLDTDGARIAFWCNLYNAATQHLLETKPDEYEKRRAFFSLPAVTVAGKTLSLDDVEHKILRRSYSKFTLGYVRNPIRGSFARQHQLSERDPRVHFVLNCGAESCPPIAAYTREDIEGQLDMATRGYLDQSVEYDPEENTVQVPRLMHWFRGDFRQSGGVTAFLRRYDQIPEDANPSLSYDDWSWSLTPGKFAEEDKQESPVQQE